MSEFDLHAQALAQPSQLENGMLALMARACEKLDKSIESNSGLNKRLDKIETALERIAGVETSIASVQTNMANLITEFSAARKAQERQSEELARHKEEVAKQIAENETKTALLSQKLGNYDKVVATVYDLEKKVFAYVLIAAFVAGIIGALFTSAPAWLELRRNQATALPEPKP